MELVKGLGTKHKEELTELISTTVMTITLKCTFVLMYCNCVQAKDNIEIASAYVICEAVREWLVDNNVAGQVKVIIIAIYMYIYASHIVFSFVGWINVC